MHGNGMDGTIVRETNDYMPLKSTSMSLSLYVCRVPMNKTMTSIGLRGIFSSER